jgi:23S rRNA pseudouridine955/2504/2580 synthase
MPQREVRAVGASFLAGGVSPHFDVAMSCIFYKTPWAHAVFSQLAASYSRASDRPIPKLKVKFFFTKIPLPSDPTLTERACGRRPCRVRVPCVQLVASHLWGEQPALGASKQVK